MLGRRKIMSDRYLAPKGERKMDAIVRVWRRQTRLVHKLRVCKMRKVQESCKTEGVRDETVK